MGALVGQTLPAVVCRSADAQPGRSEEHNCRRLNGVQSPMRNSRFIIGAVILLIGVIGYFGKTSINPVTGEKQHVSLTQDQEVALGLQAAPQMAEQFGGLDPDTDAQALVQEVGKKLVVSGPGAKTEYKFNFHLLSDPQ